MAKSFTKKLQVFCPDFCFSLTFYFRFCEEIALPSPDDQVDSPDFVYILAESLLPVDYTLAHQAGRVITNVALQLQKFNPLFTLVFTQITAMKFTVFGNILSNIAKIESHWKNFALSFDSVTRLLLRVFPNTVNSIAMIWVKTNVNRGLNFCSCNATLVMT